VLWFASILLVGKEGFHQLKSKAFGWLKLKEGPTSRSRHRFGIGLLMASIFIERLLTSAIMYLHFEVATANLATPKVVGVSFQIPSKHLDCHPTFTFIGVVASVFILGGDFWERLKSAFEWPSEKAT